MKTITSTLTRANVAMNIAMTFEPKAPKGYELTSGVVSTNMGTPTGMRILDGVLSVTISGATRPGLKLHLIGVFEKLPVNPETTTADDE